MTKKVFPDALAETTWQEFCADRGKAKSPVLGRAGFLRNVREALQVAYETGLKQGKEQADKAEGEAFVARVRAKLAEP